MGTSVCSGLVAAVVAATVHVPGDVADGEDTEPKLAEPEWPLIVVVGPTGSGKSALAVHLAEAIDGEVVSCDSVAVYRGLEIGSAKPTPAERRRVPHHGLDLFDPDETCTAGDYARAARGALAGIRQRGHVPVVAGGTGLYLRALLEGLAPAPKRDEDLRARLRARTERRGAGSLHRLLRRFDPRAAALIHPNDTPKLVRSLEVSLTGGRPQTEQWSSGREPLQGYRVLRLGLDPPRQALYARLNKRAERMFAMGLLEETRSLLGRYGSECRALGSLGYAQAGAVLRGEVAVGDAMAETQQGHRNYAKRQLTWFRREPATRWLQGFGDEPELAAEALCLVRAHVVAAPRWGGLVAGRAAEKLGTASNPAGVA